MLFISVKFLLLLSLIIMSCSFPPEPEMKFGIILSYDDVPEVIEDTTPRKSMIVKPWEGLEADTIINLPDTNND
jgi:hypothetical protein